MMFHIHFHRPWESLDMALWCCGNSQYLPAQDGPLQILDSHHRGGFATGFEFDTNCLDYSTSRTGYS
jgi:hypothetical protein